MKQPNLSRRSVLTTLPVAGAAVAALLAPSAAQAEAQPAMKAALDALQLAQRELTVATADKGGHRVKALNLIRQAIVHVEAGIQFDNRH